MNQSDVTAVLLSDGWHYLVPGSFKLVANPFAHLVGKFEHDHFTAITRDTQRTTSATITAPLWALQAIQSAAQ